MKKFYVLFSGLILGVNIIYGQYQTANWPLVYFSQVLKVTPDSFVVDSLPDGSYYGGNQANSSVSDNNGNLILYSFGIDVRNRYGNIVDGGCCLCQDTAIPAACIAGQSGNPNTQGALLLPRPGNAKQYYLFIKDMADANIEQAMRVTATLIDASANNDSGQVINADEVILRDTLSDSRMTACQHGNGRDWWLINHKYNSNRIYTHLITPDSIYGPFEQNIGIAALDDYYAWSVFSPASGIYATSTYGMNGVNLMDFDRCSGVFTNSRFLPASDTTGYWALAFSPNGRFLYADNFNYLVQYDLQSIDTPAMGVLMEHDTAGYPGLAQMVLMPNGKIYIAGITVIDSMLCVIDSPNLKYPDCAFHLRSVLVPNSVEITNVPNFPNYNLGPLIGSGCDTITDIRQQTQDIRQIQVYPNPADAYTEIKINIAGDYEAKLLNEVGQVLEVMQINTTGSFNTTGLAQGLYFIQVVNNQNVSITRKVIVLH